MLMPVDPKLEQKPNQPDLTELLLKLQKSNNALAKIEPFIKIQRIAQLLKTGHHFSIF